MKTKLLLVILLIALSFGTKAQEKQSVNFQTKYKSNPNLEKQFIDVVFGDNIVKDSQHHINLIDLLQNRVEFTTQKRESGKDYPSISQFPLFNKYNNTLTRDSSFDPNTFNVLKYDLVFFSSYTKIYRVDNTDWIIIIKPIKK